MLHTCPPGSILITPGDRSDVMIAAALAALKDADRRAGPHRRFRAGRAGVVNLCKPGFETGLPVLSVQPETATRPRAPRPDGPRSIPMTISSASNAAWTTSRSYIDADWLASPLRSPGRDPHVAGGVLLPAHRAARRRTSASSFPRATSRAPSARRPSARERGIARCVLLGNPEEIRRVAAAQEVDSAGQLEILDPAPLRAQLRRRRSSRCASTRASRRRRRGASRGQRLARHGDAGARRGGRPGLRRGPLHREHHPPGAADHQDQGRARTSSRRSSSCACRIRWWSTAIAR